MIRIFFVVIYSLTLSSGLLAGSINYNFEENIPPGVVVENAPASVVEGALKITIDEASQKWTAKIYIDVNQDIFENPVMRLRYQCGTIQPGITANIAVTIKIDDQYTQNGDAGTWRIYPELDLSAAEWQDLQVDMSPLIASWESNHGISHGNIQEIRIDIGTNNGPYVSDELNLDYIRIGDMLSLDRVEINPGNIREIIADLVVPVSGFPTKSSFTVKRDGSALTIDSVFIRAESNLVVLMENPIDIPREVLDLPTVVLEYNGNDEIKDANNVILEAFLENISFAAYAENLWKYWGEYEFSDIPYSSPWSDVDTILDGWDWSIPGFVEADSFAYFWYRDMPDLHSWCNKLNSVYVSWNELEPLQGQYNFDLLRDRIINAAIGFDGVVLRLLASVWNIDSYPTPGGYVPAWLAARDNAPRWMDNLDIAKIPSHKAIDGKYLITNMDIMDPDYHSLYKKFIEELGKSGIPQMKELKIVNVCFRSASAGEEFTAYDASNNSIEAQYSSQIIEQRIQERLKVWADAFGDNSHKLMWVGNNENACIDYAGELGIGSRHGFVEMYNSYVDMPQFGFTINSDRYIDVDEENNFIKKDVAFGDENEEYTSELRFGWKESFPYRYYVSSFRMLQQRRNYIMHAGNTLNPELTWYTGMALARRVEDAPDAWAMLSEYYLSPFANNGKAGALKNIERWLYQRDLPGFETTPAMKVPTAKDLWYADNTRPYDFTARKGKKMGFYVDDRMFPPGEQPMAIKISFYDGVDGSLKMIYKNNFGLQEDSLVTTGKDMVRTATFFIGARMDDTGFEHDFDFVLESEKEVPVFFVRVIKTEKTYANTDQSPYHGINNTIPGLIEAEDYDTGGEGFAYHDNDSKEGDSNYRPEDMVDVMEKATASNNYTLSYTNDGEWLEYTVDVLPGNYNINLYYFCGTTAGDLVISLDGEVLAIITGLENKGWEIRDSITIEKVSISGGKDKILRLEFANGAGFDIDAIQFNEVSLPINGVTLSDCPTDTLTSGETNQLIAHLDPVNADDQRISWSSSNTAVATVDANGLISALSEGDATITVTTMDGGFTAQCQISVIKAIISVLSVRIGECPGFILDEGQSHQLSALVSPVDATDLSVRWSSSDTLVATVDTNGLVRAISEGSATISVITNDGGFKSTCSIGVKSATVNSTREFEPDSKGVNVFPNPVSGTLYLEFPGENKQRIVRIFNSYGQIFLIEQAVGLNKSIDIEKLKINGFIFLQVITEQDVSTTKISVIR